MTLLCKYINNVPSDEGWDDFTKILQNEQILDDNNEISVAAMYAEKLEQSIGFNAIPSNFLFIKKICENEELIKS